MNKKNIAKVSILSVVVVALGYVALTLWAGKENPKVSLEQGVNYAKLAKEKNNLSYCKKINLPELPSIQTDCFAEVALLRNDVNICQNLKIDTLAIMCERSFDVKKEAQDNIQKIAIRDDILAAFKKYPGEGGGAEPTEQGTTSERKAPEVIRPGDGSENWQQFIDNNIGYQIFDTPASWIILRNDLSPHCGQNCTPIEDLSIQNQAYVGPPGNGPEDGSVLQLRIWEYSIADLTIRKWIENSDIPEQDKQQRIDRIKNVEIGGLNREISTALMDVDWQQGIVFIEGNRVYNFTYFSGSNAQFTKDLPTFNRILSSFITITPQVQQCPDGTKYNQCSAGKTAGNIKYFCQACNPQNRSCPNGILVNKCSVCGCPIGFKCQANGICIKNNPLVVVAVEDAILTDIQTSLDQYKRDVEQDGYAVEIHPVAENTNPAILRDYLKTQLPNGLAGVLLVGNLPVVKWETDLRDHSDSDETWSSLSNVSFSDWFLMDLDGAWLDQDGDGYYDKRENGSGDLLAEIWSGRLVPNGFGSSVALLNNYFRKNHAYRTGQLTLPKKALIYDAGWGYLPNNANLIYGNDVDIVPFSDSSADDYKTSLVKGYEWMEAYYHSNPTYHAFTMTNETIQSNEIYSIDPKVFFYVLNACSAARYTVEEYLGGAYVFAPNYGLAVFGGTAILSDAINFYFYHILTQSKNLGETFKEYFNYLLLNVDGADREYYDLDRLILLGDPTLKIF